MLPPSLLHFLFNMRTHRVRIIPALISFMILVRTVGFFMWSCSACGLPCACCKILCITGSVMISCKTKPVSIQHAAAAASPLYTHGNLGIAHRTLHRLLLRLVRALRADRALYLKRELLDLTRALRPRRLVMLTRNIERLERLGVLTQRKQHVALAYVRLD